MIRRPPRSTLFPYRRSSDLCRAGSCSSDRWTEGGGVAVRGGPASGSPLLWADALLKSAPMHKGAAIAIVLRPKRRKEELPRRIWASLRAAFGCQTLWNRISILAEIGKSGQQ